MLKLNELKAKQTTLTTFFSTNKNNTKSYKFYTNGVRTLTAKCFFGDYTFSLMSLHLMTNFTVKLMPCQLLYR